MESIAAAVLLGAAENALAKPGKFPIVLYSWIDPAFLPANAMLNLDDSALGVVEQVVLMHERKEEGAEGQHELSVPSKLSWFPPQMERDVRQANRKIGRNDFAQPLTLGVLLGLD
jgi:hypothetical protein